MSLLLGSDSATTPGIEVKTHGFPSSLRGVAEIRNPNGEISIGFKDFFAAVYYVLTNTDLVDDDPRLAFVEAIKSMKAIPGFNGPPAKRLHGPYPYSQRYHPYPFSKRSKSVKKND